jgi:hypothetical protein
MGICTTLYMAWVLNRLILSKSITMTVQGSFLSFGGADEPDAMI